VQTGVNRALGCGVLILMLTGPVGFRPALMANAVGDGQDMMEDPCAGDMQWMIGWCIDMMTAAEFSAAIALTSASSGTNSGAFEPIEVPGAIGTRAFGINPQGDIVGSFTDAAGTHGYLLRKDVFTQIDYPGAATTEAFGINARGDVIGRYTRKGMPGIRGFLLQSGRYTDISIGNHLITLPTKIGASGEIVGCFHDMSGLVDMYGYVQRGDDVSVFSLPSSVAPTGSAAMHNGVVRGGGLIVGLTNPAPGRTRGYVIAGDTLSYLDGPGSTFTQAWDVNPSGVVVGNYEASGRTHGFYYDDGAFVTLDVPGSTLTVARGINPRGDIVGVYNTATGAHGFVLRK
jgi:uncharacterized membrane protein